MTPRGAAPSIGIAIPVRNGLPHLKITIGSILEQEYRGRIDIMVKDANSNDGTVEYLETMKDQDERVQYRSGPDGGQSDAVNQALSELGTDLVLWLNADDRLRPGSLTTLARPFADKAADVDLVYGDYAKIRPDGSTIRRYSVGPMSRERLFRRGCYIFSGSCLWNREQLLAAGGLDVSLHYVMDLDLLLRASEWIRGYEYVPQRVVDFLIHDESKTMTSPGRFVSEAYRVRKRNATGLSERARAALLAGKTAAYSASRGLWHSRVWSRVRPEKTYG